MILEPGMAPRVGKNFRVTFRFNIKVTLGTRAPIFRGIRAKEYGEPFQSALAITVT